MCKVFYGNGIIFRPESILSQAIVFAYSQLKLLSSNDEEAKEKLKKEMNDFITSGIILFFMYY